MGWSGPATHRQHLTELAWLREDFNHPSRTDQYLMQLTRELLCTPARVWGKEPNGVEIQHCRLTFGTARPAEKKAEAEQAAVANRARALSRMTMPVKVVTVPRASDGDGTATGGDGRSPDG